MTAMALRGQHRPRRKRRPTMEDRRFNIDDLTRIRITALAARRRTHYEKPQDPEKLRFFDAVTYAYELIAMSMQPLNGYEIRRMINADPSLSLCDDQMHDLLKRVSGCIRIERRAAHRQYLRLHPDVSAALSSSSPFPRKE